MRPTPELLLAHTRPGPRYTSYPTAPHWRRDFSETDRAAMVRGIGTPASVYVHVPFCREQCTFCGCHMVVGRHQVLGDRYLDALSHQIAALPLPEETLPVVRIHLGGGTPTWLDPAQLERLFGLLRRRFRPIEGAEISVEADPEITTDEQVDVLADLGVNRLSLGVQSFEPRVLAAVNRPQGASRVVAVLERARGHGMQGLNVDLMYGLPYQNMHTFSATLDRTLALRPDRLAVFGYAHVPWLKPHQRQLPEAALPGPVERTALFLHARDRLTEAGYQAIGMDHFALPGDELSVAQWEGRLHRNFMGYTTRPELELIGLGPSAISELRGGYVQDLPKLGPWWRAVETGGPLVERGCTLTEEDRLRRTVINELMCNFSVSWDRLASSHGDVRARLAEEIGALAPLEADGLVERHPGGVRVTALGRYLVRNVAMVFDAHLAPVAGRPRYSQTV